MADDQIIAKGTGWTIAISDVAETLVPYLPGPLRANGTQNLGWLDLRGRPELVDEVPELGRSDGFSELVRAIAHPASKIMSGGCECGEFSRTEDPPIYVGGYVSTMFHSVEENQDRQNFVRLARYLLAGVTPTDEHHMSFEFIIEPLKEFFGQPDCFCLVIKPFGHGHSSGQAWCAFDFASFELARSLVRDRPVNQAEP